MHRFYSVILASAVMALPSCGHNVDPEPPTADGLSWGPAPANFPAGAQMAVIQGSPSANELFTVRLRMPDGYRIAPHTHPTEEDVTVLRGTFLVGMGEKFDSGSMQALDVDGFAAIPRGHPHFAQARGETIVQVHAVGPFAMTYVNPADDPTSSAGR